MTTSDHTAEFVSLWTASSRQVYSFILSLLPHWADADEAYQETSRLLWEKFDQFEPGTDFTSWACRTAYYKVLDVRRLRQRGPMAFSDAFVGAIEQAATTHRETISPRYAAMLECLQKLSDRDRELIQRRYRDGATAASVAEDLGRSVDAIYKAVNRVHEALFDCIRRTLSRGGY